MNKVIVYEATATAAIVEDGKLYVTLTNGDWASVEDLKVLMNVPNKSGLIQPTYSIDGSALTIGGSGFQFPQGEYLMTISGNLNGVFQLVVAMNVTEDGDAETEVELSLPASGGAGGGMLSVTHAELLALRNEGKLVAGQQYRITDYVATTTDTESASANHPFDIIVVADDVNVLNENARAVAHEGDEYFAKCCLPAWKLRYCIDNDMDRFTWADEENGKGVIFEMIDENNNRACYDFKGIVFKRYKVTETDGTSTSLVGTYANKCDEDSKLTLDESDFRLCYLFNVAFDDLNEDDSVGFYYGIPNNNNFKHNGTLLNGVFHISSQNGSPYGCTAGVNSYNWTCGNECCSWTCGDNSHSWTCGDACHSWTCGTFCFSWTCGNYCYRWECRNECTGWTCGNDCVAWTCMDECSNWMCGNNCHSWTCENECEGWTCGDNCIYWRGLSGGFGSLNLSEDCTDVINAKGPYYIGKNSDGSVNGKNLFD